MTKLMLEARLMAFLDKVPEDADIEAVVLAAPLVDGRFCEYYEGTTCAVLRSAVEFVTTFADDDAVPKEVIREFFTKTLSDEYWPDEQE